MRGDETAMHDAAFTDLFKTLAGKADGPFPWQEDLFERFMAGRFDRNLDIPTGLGKTAVMAIWLAARAKGAKIARRLVYIVDRRAVVDQATTVAEGLCEAVYKDSRLKEVLGLGSRPLAISTLRGKHVDNREWLEDPSMPAIILGTIDMIGSRLLFEGYGVSRKMRPYHAGLLGADALFVLDEAHLVPAFERLLETIASGVFGSKNGTSIVPAFKLMSLSATGRARDGQALTLSGKDLEHPVVKERLGAEKKLELRHLAEGAKLPDELASAAWELTKNEESPRRVIVFCNLRDVAEKAKSELERLAKGHAIDTELFVGGRRVHERERAQTRLEDLGFIAGKKINRDKPAFVFATSAGEVGVDLDADDMVSDLVEWDRMIQRLGRVNRRGEGRARVVVLLDECRKATDDKQARQAIFKQAMELLPQHEDYYNASPGSIRAVKLAAQPAANENADHDAHVRNWRCWVIEKASTPEPLRPELSRPVVEAWSMTSLEEHTGRPEVAPWLRGWVDDESQTKIVWRTHLPTRDDGAVEKNEIEDYFEAAQQQTSEELERETWRAQKWLLERAKSRARAEAIGKRDVVAVVFGPSGDLRRSIRLEELIFDGKDKKERERVDQLLGCLPRGTLIVDARLGGLTKEGLLDDGENGAPNTLDSSLDWKPPAPFRVRPFGTGTEAGWRVIHRFVKVATEEGDGGDGLVVEKRLGVGTTEEGRAVSNPQLLEVHQQEAARLADEIASGLGLEGDWAKMLRVAARLHDEGKRAKRWQRAFNAPDTGIFAKTCGPVNVAMLEGYRHEFRSMRDAKGDATFKELPSALQELCLHLIAAHHGYARPVIGTGGWDDEPPTRLEGLAREVAERFARLQQEWGPWGLAWWESLLRAVDAQASRENDARKEVE